MRRKLVDPVAEAVKRAVAEPMTVEGILRHAAQQYYDADRKLDVELELLTDQQNRVEKARELRMSRLRDLLAQVSVTADKPVQIIPIGLDQYILVRYTGHSNEVTIVDQRKDV